MPFETLSKESTLSRETAFVEEDKSNILFAAQRSTGFFVENDSGERVAFSHKQSTNEASDGFIPGKALELSRELFSFSKDRIETELGCSLTEKQYREMSERIQIIGPHLVEATRTSPYTKCAGSYSKVRRYYSRIFEKTLRLHDIFHSAVAFELNNDPAPSFLKAESQINDKQLIREEIHTLVLWQLMRIAKVEEISSIEEALEIIKNNYIKQIASTAFEEALKEGRGYFKAFMAGRKAIKAFEEFFENPDSIFSERVERIFNETKKGNEAIAVEEFLTMTNDIEPIK